MGTIASERWTEPNTGRDVDMAASRRWSSPDIILLITDFLDEKSIQFHAIQQARPSGAKVLLVQVERQDPNAIARTQHLLGALSSTKSIYSSPDAAERMAANLRWSGVGCEPIVVRSMQAKEIPSIAASCGADRVLVSAPIDQSDSRLVIAGVD